MSAVSNFSEEELAAVVDAVRATGGLELQSFNDKALEQAVSERMRATGCNTPARYANHLKNDKHESRELLEALSLGVTRFFRDPDVFDEVARAIVPEVVDIAAGHARPIRLWVAGCASGEEAYTLAALFLNAEKRDAPELRICATDIDEEALCGARSGIYPANVENDVPEDFRREYFEECEGRYRVSSRLRAVCEFAHHDLNDPVPVAQADLISCRYVLMHLELSARQRILARFYEALRPGGWLLVGPAEDVHGVENLFEAHEKRHGIYRARSDSLPQDVTPGVDRSGRSEESPASNAQETNPEMSLAEQLELRNAELERLNRKLEFQVEQLETTLSLVPVGIAICEDRECEKIRVNREGGVLLGVPENSNIATPEDADSADPEFSIRSLEDRDAPAELPIRQVLKTGKEISDQSLRVIRSDRSELDILLSAVPLLDENRRPRGAIAAFVDNTDQAEERRKLVERHEAERAVSRLGIEILSEQNVDVVMKLALEALVDGLDIELAGVFEHRPSEDCLVLRAGRGWQELDPEDAVLPLDSAIHTESNFVFGDIREERRFSPPAWLVEQRAVSGAGTAISRQGERFGALVVFTRSKRHFSDVETNFLETVAALLAAAFDRDRMERVLAETRDRLNLADARQAAERTEQLAALGTLAAGISHEINNPLNSILVNAELGLMKLDSGQEAERIRPVLETVVEDVQRCARITESVLNLAKKSDAPKSAGNLNDIVLRARELVASHLQLHDASVDLELGDLPTLELDANAMESAMVNLLRNAAESGRLGVSILVRTRAEANAVIAEVSDDGPGIAPQHIDHVFDPFYSTKRSDKGTGLGLSLVHNTITDHGGKIRVTSRVGEGTTFEIELPVTEQPEDSDDDVVAG